MSKSKIAPALTTWLAECDRHGFVWHGPMAKEFRALLAVARAAAHGHRGEDEYLDRALDRLDRVSRKAKP